MCLNFQGGNASSSPQEYDGEVITGDIAEYRPVEEQVNVKSEDISNMSESINVSILCIYIVFFLLLLLFLLVSHI